MKSGTNPEEKVENGSDFASMLTKYKKKAAQDDETKKAETGETKNKETQPEETKNRGNEKQVNGRQSGENEKTAEIKAEIKVTDIQDEKNSQDGEKEQEQELLPDHAVRDPVVACRMILLKCHIFTLYKIRHAWIPFAVFSECMAIDTSALYLSAADTGRRYD